MNDQALVRLLEVFTHYMSNIVLSKLMGFVVILLEQIFIVILFLCNGHLIFRCVVNTAWLTLVLGIA